MLPFNDSGFKTALKITFFYAIFVIILLLFRGGLADHSAVELLQDASYLVLTGIVFGVLTYFIYKSTEKTDTDNIDTEESVKNEELEELKAKIEKADSEKEKAVLMNKVKTQFLSNMSQEIRTPMSGIIGMTELMMLTNPTKEQKEYLDIINFSSSTLLAIINDILDFSRIETGDLKLERIDFNIRELAQKTSHMLDFDARRKKLTLKCSINKDINYYVLGDPLRINQILINILKNAVKHTEKGGVELSLEEKEKSEDRVVLRFRIADTGKGMDAEKLDALFGKRGKDKIVSMDDNFEYKGIGFGVPIIIHLIKMMGGTLFVNSEENKGTEFVFDLPLELSSQEALMPEGVALKTAAGKISILVAEDNVVNQRLLKELLVRKDYGVTIVENGLKIFDLLEHNSFDLILMDVQMPIMDGLEATSIIREIEKGTGRHIPIIGITAYAVKADREKCLGAGMDDYMSKPFVKEEFYNMIEKYIIKP